MFVSLLGYMGSGKSTIGRKLAYILNYKFIDLDEYIISQEKKSINDIFQENGEIYFRKAENSYLNEVLNKENIVLSLGGGTPVYYNNIDLINQKSVSFYLKMNPAQLAKRLIPQKDHRPIISHLSEEDILEFIAKHLFERAPYYEKSHYKIDNNSGTETEACTKIIEVLKKL